MRKITAVFIVIVLLAFWIFLPACGNTAQPTVESVSEPSSSVQSEAPVSESAPPASAPDKTTALPKFTYLPAVDFLDESLFALQSGAAADYVGMDYDDFYEVHHPYELFDGGITDADSYISGNIATENYVGGSTLIFDERHKKPVAADIAVGSAMSAVRERFGEPGFSHADYRLIGYKTKTFYIAFVGGETVERIYLSKRYPQTKADDFLPEFYNEFAISGYGVVSKNDYDKVEGWNLSATQIWRGSKTFYSPCGIELWDTGDGYPTMVYKDFEGRVPVDISDRMHINFSDTDYPEHKIYTACAEEHTIREKLAGGLEPEYFSPDKSIAIIPYNETVTERSGYLMCYLDGSKPFRFFGIGGFPGRPYWLNNRYIGFTTMYRFAIHDLEKESFYTDNAEFGLLAETVSQYTVESFSPDKKTFLIQCFDEAYVLTPEANNYKKPADYLTPAEDERVLITYDFANDGSLTVDYRVVSVP